MLATLLNKKNNNKNNNESSLSGLAIYFLLENARISFNGNAYNDDDDDDDDDDNDGGDVMIPSTQIISAICCPDLGRSEMNERRFYCGMKQKMLNIK